MTLCDKSKLKLIESVFMAKSALRQHCEAKCYTLIRLKMEKCAIALSESVAVGNTNDVHGLQLRRSSMFTQQINPIKSFDSELGLQRTNKKFQTHFVASGFVAFY